MTSRASRTGSREPVDISEDSNRRRIRIRNQKVCPTCFAGPGEACFGVRGERMQLHQARRSKGNRV